MGSALERWGIWGQENLYGVGDYFDRKYLFQTRIFAVKLHGLRMARADRDGMRLMNFQGRVLMGVS
jgi:hypothetical protein